MAKITLREKLLNDGHISRSIMTASHLIDNLELYGFVNSEVYKPSYNEVPSGIIINKPDLTICSSYIKAETSPVIPVFRTLSVCTEETYIDVKNIHSPYLSEHRLYKEIHTRYGTGKIVTEAEWDKYKNAWPSRFSFNEGKIMLHIEKGNILFLDKDDCIKGVESEEEEALALCRYLCKDSGEIKYMFFSLDQLFYKITDAKKKS